MTAAAPRVYWLTEEFYPPEIGGVELMASWLSQGLAAAGVPVQVITRRPHGTAAREQLGNVQVRRIPPRGQLKGRGWRAAPRVLGFLARLAAILLGEARQYEVIIVSGMKIIPLVAVPVARLLRKRIYVRVESTFELLEPISADSLREMSGPGRALHSLLGRWQRHLLRRADRVIATSGEIEKQLERIGLPAPRIARIPNAVDLERFAPAYALKPQLREQLGLREDATLVLFVGRLSRAKGVLLLLEAWPQVLAVCSQAQLALVGTGRGSFDDCEAQLAEGIRTRGLAGSVRLVGPSDRVERFLQAADVYVLPSEYEGFGLGIIEAMGCALPIAVTPVGVARDVIRDGENGFLFQIGDAAAIAAVLQRMLSQRARWQDIGLRARESVLRYSLKSVIEQYVALCRETRAPVPCAVERTAR